MSSMARCSPDLLQFPPLPSGLQDERLHWSYGMRRSMQEIIPGLFLGPYLSASRQSGQSLLDAGVTHIICVRQPREAHIIKPQFPQSFKYLVLDIVDHYTENIIQHFPKAREFINSCFTCNGKALVHGCNGVSRSAAIVIGYIMEQYGLDFQSAFNIVQQKRYCINPNEAFVQQLKEYEPIYKARLAQMNGQSSQSQNRKLKRRFEEDELLELPCNDTHGVRVIVSLLSESELIIMGKAKNEKLDTPPRDKLLRNKLITQLKEDCMLLEDGQLGRPFAWDAFEGIYDLVERIRSLEPIPPNPPTDCNTVLGHYHKRLAIATLMLLNALLLDLHHIMPDKKQSPWSKSSREESLEAFKQWCAAEEIIVSGVEIAPFESYGLGLKCTEDSPVGKCLVSVPEKCMMTLKTASKGSLGLLASDDPILKHMPNVLLALHVLEERWSPNSFWLAYLNVLPNEYSNTLYFTKEEYQLLKGSHALEEATNQYRCIARQYAYFSGLFKVSL
ncbi:unnamed protein product [Darwinula stevensoni]|uniref:protein-histidine N-methyltransferase n=1 Tax=Darwinula stevensoni TaxID=69355 RepID=A0A7R8X6B9_9CRUS|nr:unnamed protein product [Darwinula stevensoni]CAG0885597.1 unnamed protein product [Darwinula stevensoni]